MKSQPDSKEDDAQGRGDLRLDPEETRLELQPMTAFIVEALEVGTTRAREVIDEAQALLGEDLKEVHAQRTFSRFFTKNELKRLTQDGAEQHSFTLRHILNTGIHIDFKRFSLKVLRPGPNGQPPVASSRARERFFAQEEEWVQPSLFVGQEDQRPRRNLIYIWSTNSSGGLAELTLWYPPEGNGWIEKLPLVISDAPSSSEAENRHLADDLDIKKRPEELDDEKTGEW